MSIDSRIVRFKNFELSAFRLCDGKHNKSMESQFRIRLVELITY